MTKFLELLHGFIWGVPALILMIGVGLYLSVITGFSQVTLLPRALGLFWRKLAGRGTDHGVSPFRALCTALAATVGTGNLVGVAGAICLGGPGAVFWMWVCGLLGMATKFGEAVLAVRFRTGEAGAYRCGPMYMMLRGLGEKWRPMAAVYAGFGVIAALGVGNTAQINAVVSGFNGILCRFGGRESQLGNLLLGIVLAALIGRMLLGGAGRIGETAERLVPFLSAAYIVLCVVVLGLRFREIPGAFRAIVRGAFSPKAVTGGILGSVFQTLRVGCSRGVFTNEAGMGTASMAHGCADVAHPCEQGLMGIMEVFLDTIVICTMTALVILCSGIPIPYGQDAGNTLTTAAFSAVCGEWVSVFIAGALCCFAFATVLGWGLYGGQCAVFLFGPKGWRYFALVQTATVIFGAVMHTEAVWLLSETVNGLMAIPNLITLAALSPELKRLLTQYKQKIRPGAGGGILCKFPLTQTGANPRPCGNSTLTRWRQKSRANTSTT